MLKKSLTFSLLVRELLADILVFHNRLKPGVIGLPRKKKHPRSRAYTRTNVHTYEHLPRVHARIFANSHTCTQTQPPGANARTRSQTYSSARKRMHTRINSRTRAKIHAHMCSCKYPSANVRIPAQTYTCMYEDAWHARMHIN